MSQAVITILVQLAAALPAMIDTITKIVEAWHAGDMSAVKALAAVLPDARAEALAVEADIAAQTALAHT